jgi:succinylglutamate desuccinylase
MKFIVFGGTHGNEPVGIKAMQALSGKFLHEYETKLANPGAYKIQKRFVDSDLNRSFGEKGESLGYEKTRSLELTKEIKGKFDFMLDLHTTTSNMGLTIIITRLDDASLKAACFLQETFPEMKIIVSSRVGLDCPYTSDLALSALTVEVGPVANNVVNADLVISTLNMVKSVLNFDFTSDYDYSNFECFHTIGIINYPEQGEWMVHPSVDTFDFHSLKNGDPLFINTEGEVLNHSGEDNIFPLFVNEAAYQNDGVAMEYSAKTTLDIAISKA